MRLPLSWFALALVGGLLASGAQAGTVTLDFEDLTCARSQAQCEVGDQYTARGFALRYSPAEDEPLAAGLVGVGTAWKANRKGSLALSIRSCDTQVSLMANDNQPFSLLSIDLAEMTGEGPTAVTFRGLKEDGSEVRQTFKLGPKPGWQRYTFDAGFRGLNSVQWAQGDCLNQRPHMVDNLVLASSVKP
ncbi:MAG: hypothetical protein RI907_2542 [Pseudomonadota bacterium]|jgi:hypothetical protein